MPLTIMIDIDGVLNNLNEAVLDVYNEDAKDNLTTDDITEYYIENFVKPEFKDNFNNYFVDKRVWKRIKVIDYCQEIIEKLNNERYNIIFVTATECENMTKKRNWLQRNFPFIQNMRSKFFLCTNKQLIRADIAIDDGLFNLIGDRTYHSICLNKPYNQTNESIPNFYRVNNWKEVYDTIKLIESKFYN
jgi:5'(3')-deoxyribonucleotidase